MSISLLINKNPCFSITQYISSLIFPLTSFLFTSRGATDDPCRVHLMDVPEEIEKTLNAPTRTYVRDAKAMAATPVDVKGLPNAYVIVIDMPRIRSWEMMVQVEDDNVLVISGERKHANKKVKKGENYLLMERWMGKLMRKFALPDNADTDTVSEVFQDRVHTVTVKKHSPPEPKNPRTIEVKVA